MKLRTLMALLRAAYAMGHCAGRGYRPIDTRDALRQFEREGGNCARTGQDLGSVLFEYAMFNKDESEVE